MNVRAAIVALLLAVSIGCIPPTADTTPTQPPAPTTIATPVTTATTPATATPTVARASPSPTQLLATPTPAKIDSIPRPVDRDLEALYRRFNDAQALPTATPTVSRRVGDREQFWLTNFNSNTHYQTMATLRLQSDHADFYVAEGLDVSQDALQRSADDFERDIYPSVWRYVGGRTDLSSPPGPRLTVLNANIPGVGGYFSVADRYPRAINPFSNERELIYVNIAVLRPGTESYKSVLAHEFTHAVHWYIHPNEEAWISEGTAELGAMLATGTHNNGVAFRTQPNTQLNTWAEDPAASIPHYGASHLFMTYLAEHYGGFDRLHQMLTQGADGIDGIDTYLRGAGINLDFDAIFRDWVVANLLDGDGIDRYDYSSFDVQSIATDDLAPSTSTNGEVNQYAARYYRVDAGQGRSLRVQFSGSPNVEILPTQPRSGAHVWWSNRGDAIDDTLTREFDLTAVTSASLEYWIWHQIEPNYDLGYLAVSVDGGSTWDLLEAPSMSKDNPVGNAIGPGYTGKSGGASPTWIHEVVDISRFAGKKVLVRFEYVTDEAFNDFGFAIDDVQIPEIGFRDDVEQGTNGWIAQGFVRTDNSLEQRFAVQTIAPGDPPQVGSIALDTMNRGEAVLPDGSFMVVSGMTRHTTEPARYTLVTEQVP